MARGGRFLASNPLVSETAAPGAGGEPCVLRTRDAARALVAAVPRAGTMAKKVVKKKGAKAKGPAYYTDQDGVDHCAPFGFAPNDIITTPIGLRGTVLGVKYDKAAEREGGVMWVKYDGTGREAPIENPTTTDGYSRDTEGAHVRREVQRIREEVLRKEAVKEAALALIRAKEAEEAAKAAALAAKQAKPKKKKAKAEAPPADGKENGEATA